MAKRTRAGAGSRRDLAEDFRAMGSEIALLYFRLVALLQYAHGTSNMSTGGRSLLLSLREVGPSTVPELAATRRVSRQYVQQLADEMAGQGWVTFVDNPAHRRSKRVQLTIKGNKHLDAMIARETPLIAALAKRFSRQEIRHAAAFARALRDHIDAELAER